LILRTHGLRDLPPGLFCDEAGLGYNAYSIATAGTDEEGKVLPLFFWSFGVSYKNPIYIYAAALPVRLLGLNELSIRLPAALFGVATVAAVFFLGVELFGPWVGLYAAALLALAPWHLHFSRIAFELISFPFFFVVGATYLVRFTNGKPTLARAMFFLGMCVYTYAVADLIVPLFLLGFVLLYLPTLWRRRWETLRAAAVLLATVLPAVLFLSTHAERGTRYIESTGWLTSSDSTWYTKAEHLARNYLEFFSPPFLLESGDPVMRHAVRGFGELLPSCIPFLIIGALVAAVYPNRPTKLLLWWLLLYPVAPSLMNEVPSASRGIIGVPVMCLLAAIGLAASLRVVGWLAQRRSLAAALQGVALVAVAYQLGLEATRYLRSYALDYPAAAAPGNDGFQYGYGETIRYMESARPHYDQLLLTTTDTNQAQIFPLFYAQQDPRRRNASERRPEDLGYLILDPAEYQRYKLDRPILYQLRPADLDLFSDLTILKDIVAPGGQQQFVIAEVRARKRFLTTWRMLGPLANKPPAERETPQLPPVRKDGFAGPFGTIYWRSLSTPFVRVDLNRIYRGSDPRNPSDPEAVCAYASATLTGTAADAHLELAGSDDTMLAWLNGRPIISPAATLTRAAQRWPLPLKPGANELMLKSCKTAGDWYLTARITDSAGSDLTSILVTTEIPEAPPAARAPQPDRDVQLVDGFAAATSFKHEEASRPDYRGLAQAWPTFLEDEQGQLVWQTAPCEGKKRTIAAFAATMSPQQGEAELFVNGSYALTFQLLNARELTHWTRGAYRMTFVPKCEIEGSSGVMLVDVPADQVQVGTPLELRVVPVRGEGNPWFTIKSYVDTIAHEQLTLQVATDTMQGKETALSRQACPSTHGTDGRPPWWEAGSSLARGIVDGLRRLLESAVVAIVLGLVINAASARGIDRLETWWTTRRNTPPNDDSRS
jgi:hypothetical protein